MIGAPFATPDNPRLLANLDLLDRNIATMAVVFARHSVGWRPHPKGIKLPAIAHMPLHAGAIGGTCAKHGEAELEARQTLGEVVGSELYLAGTHLGCKHGGCGACTVLHNGEAIRGCLMLAVQAPGVAITTIEGVCLDVGLTRLQESFRRHHGFQCGLCTPAWCCRCSSCWSDSRRWRGRGPRGHRRQSLSMHRLPDNRGSCFGSTAEVRTEQT